MKDNIPTGDLAYIVSCDSCAPKKTEVRDGALRRNGNRLVRRWELRILRAAGGTVDVVKTSIYAIPTRVRNLHHDEHYETEKSLTQKSGLSRR